MNPSFYKYLLAVFKHLWDFYGRAPNSFSKWLSDAIFGQVWTMRHHLTETSWNSTSAHSFDNLVFFSLGISHNLNLRSSMNLINNFLICSFQWKSNTNVNTRDRRSNFIFCKSTLKLWIWWGRVSQCSVYLLLHFFRC